MEAQIVIDYTDIRFVFTGTRNEVSGKFKEKIALYKHDILINETPVSQLADFAVFGYNSVFALIKSYHRHLLEEEVDLPHYYNHHFGVMMGRFKRSKQWRAGIEEQIVKYQEALYFKYEFNPRIKVKQSGVYLDIYGPNKRKDSVKVTFRKESNRRYHVFCTVIFEPSATSLKSYSYEREMGVDNFDVLLKQLDKWMEQTQNSLGHIPRFKDLHNGSRCTLKDMKDDVSMIIERLNKGWEV